MSNDTLRGALLIQSRCIEGKWLGALPNDRRCQRGAGK